jgi:large subunit ribosomal protein L4
VVHGPTPRDYTQRTPKKMKAAALRGALSDRARHARVHVVSAAARRRRAVAKAAAARCAAISDRKNLLVIVERDDAISWKSLRNLQNVHLLVPDQLNTYDVLCSDAVIFTEGALARSSRARAAAERAGRRDRAEVERRERIGKIQPRPARHPARAGGLEKSYGLLDENKYTFLVDPGANKTEIKIAVEQVFGVKVTGSTR